MGFAQFQNAVFHVSADIFHHALPEIAVDFCSFILSNIIIDNNLLSGQSDFGRLFSNIKLPKRSDSPYKKPSPKKRL